MLPKDEANVRSGGESNPAPKAAGASSWKWRLPIFSSGIALVPFLAVLQEQWGLFAWCNSDRTLVDDFSYLGDDCKDQATR